MDLLISPELLGLLRCPRTKQALHLASSEESTQWQDIDEEAEGFLVSEDGTVAYPIADGFPILLLDRALTKPSLSPEPNGDGHPAP